MIALLLLIASARADVIDRVVASVGEQLVTSSEVRIEADLSPLDLDESPFWAPGHLDPQTRLIDAAIVRELAGDLTLYQPLATDVDARVAAIRGQIGEGDAFEAFLRVHGLDDDAFAALVRRRMVVERYLQRNVSVRSTSDPDWLPACDHMLEQSRPSMRIRIVPEIPQ